MKGCARSCLLGLAGCLVSIAGFVLLFLRFGADPNRTDDDGFFRRDKHGADEADLSLCHLDEQIIAQGAQVCVLGLYSQAKGGIIPDPNWANQTRISLGDGEVGLLQLGTRARRYFIGASVLAATAAGIAWAYISTHMK